MLQAPRDMRMSTIPDTGVGDPILRGAHSGFFMDNTDSLAICWAPVAYIEIIILIMRGIAPEERHITAAAGNTAQTALSLGGKNPISITGRWPRQNHQTRLFQTESKDESDAQGPVLPEEAGEEENNK